MPTPNTPKTYTQADTDDAIYRFIREGIEALKEIGVLKGETQEQDDAN